MERADPAASAAGSGKEARLAQRMSRAAEAARRLILYSDTVRTTPMLRTLAALVQALAAPQEEERLWELARELACHVLDAANGVGSPPALSSQALPPQALSSNGQLPALKAAPAWQACAVEAVLADDNPFSRAAAATAEPGEVPAGLRAAAAHDLRCLQALAGITPYELDAALEARGVPWPKGILQGYPRADGAGPLLRPRPDRVQRLYDLFGSSSDWASLVEEVAAYHREVGAGMFGRFAALRWEGDRLAGVPQPDPTRLEQLVGYEQERGQVVLNTERLVTGLVAHHVLLYGPRGTGKSVTVKALVHAFADRGLRVVELPTAHLSDLPRLFNLLRSQRQRFVIFVDDLSFAGGERAYRELKSLLEGGLITCPPNARVYATSNRRHLVEERPVEEGVARPQDEINDRISLADRFGVTVYFPPADQPLYLKIVEGLARQAGLVGEDGSGSPTGGLHAGGCGVAGGLEELRRRALLWANRYNDRSPRTASQFVAELLAERLLAGRRAGQAAPAQRTHPPSITRPYQIE